LRHSCRFILARLDLRPSLMGNPRRLNDCEQTLNALERATLPPMILSVIHDVARQRAARKAARVPVMLTA
jgi:hypothetical protein